MRWRYQLIRHGDDLAVHEVYGNGDEIVSWTERPVTFGGDTLADVLWTLTAAMEDIRKYPILDIKDLEAPSNGDSTEIVR